MRRTKIVATIGPASQEPDVLVRMIEAGMDVARLNFSHGNRELHQENAERVRAAASQAGRPVAILQDLPGPKLRIGALEDSSLVALRLAAGHGEYMIHGTNNPTAVGMAVTHGCIRMYPEDVAALFGLIPIGTHVRLVNEPVKVAWVGGQLFLEAHPPVDAEGQVIEPDLNLLSSLLDKALGSDTAAIEWDLARTTLQAASGIPTLVGLAADPDKPADGAASGATQAQR